MDYCYLQPENKARLWILVWNCKSSIYFRRSHWNSLFYFPVLPLFSYIHSSCYTWWDLQGQCQRYIPWNFPFPRHFFKIFGVEQFIKAEKLIDICCSTVKRQSLISDYILKGKTLTVFSTVQHLLLRSFPLGDLTSHMTYALLFIIAAWLRLPASSIYFFIFLTISMSLLLSKFIFFIFWHQ